MLIEQEDHKILKANSKSITIKKEETFTSVNNLVLSRNKNLRDLLDNPKAKIMYREKEKALKNELSQNRPLTERRLGAIKLPKKVRTKLRLKPCDRDEFKLPDDSNFNLVQNFVDEIKTTVIPINNTKVLLPHKQDVGKKVPKIFNTCFTLYPTNSGEKGEIVSREQNQLGSPIDQRIQILKAIPKHSIRRTTSNTPIKDVKLNIELRKKKLQVVENEGILLYPTLKTEHSAIATKLVTYDIFYITFNIT